MITFSKISLEEELDWNDLISNSSTATFFQTKEWLTIWVKYWGKNSEVLIYAVFDNEKLIGIAPLEITVDKVNFLGLSPVLGKELVSDFGDIITVAGREKEIWEAILAKLNNETMEKWDNVKLEFNFIREDSPSFEILKGLDGQLKEVDVAPYIELPKTWNEYLLMLDRHDRHELRRKMRRLAGEGVVEYCYNGAEKEIQEFFRLMALSNEQKRDFLSLPMKNFFLDIFKAFYDKGSMRLCFLNFNGEYIAAVVLFYFKDEVLLYNSGFDPKYSNLSPGLVLKAMTIKKAIEEGKKRFDFLRGGERYKYDLGGKERKLYKIKFD